MVDQDFSALSLRAGFDTDNIPTGVTACIFQNNAAQTAIGRFTVFALTKPDQAFTEKQIAHAIILLRQA